MKNPDRAAALAVLRHLSEGAQVDGIRFGPVLQLLITSHSSAKPIEGQVYINLVSRWAVFESLPTPLPTSENNLLELESDEAMRTLCSIRETEIERVELGDDAPHLMLFLKGGKVFFLNGNHDQYETWQCGVSMGNRSESWMVVSCPGGGLAVWAPKNFHPAWPTV